MDFISALKAAYHFCINFALSVSSLHETLRFLGVKLHPNKNLSRTIAEIFVVLFKMKRRALKGFPTKKSWILKVQIAFIHDARIHFSAHLSFRRLPGCHQPVCASSVSHFFRDKHRVMFFDELEFCGLPSDVSTNNFVSKCLLNETQEMLQRSGLGE